MTEAICAGDGAGAAACFTPDGIYNDVFYGAFKGAEIADMVENYFHRDGSSFLWDIHSPVEDEGMGYARYVFSYESRLAGHEGRRAVFEGVCYCKLHGGLISEYREIANAATGLAMIGFDDARIARFAHREAAALSERADCAHHVKS